MSNAYKKNSSREEPLVREWHKKFYAVITPTAVGVFTKWDVVSKMITGTPNKNKRFHDYFEAVKYLKKNMSDEDQKAFGLLDKLPAFDRIYKRDPWLKKSK